ncbi:MAG: hypothetical protein FJ144_03705 [Deltaproteobacteria bacterium]|nr:hypothetical protein [Deltaproteobacteria bacterium]
MSEGAMVPRIVQVQILRPSSASEPAHRLRPLPWRRDVSAFFAQLDASRARRATEPRRSDETKSAPDEVPSADASERLSPWLRTPSRRALAAEITRASNHAGLEPDLSLAVAVAESSLDPTARSSDGLSTGTFQVTEPTEADVRRRFARGELVRPPGTDDVAIGVAHLRYLDDLFERDASLGRSLRTVAVDDPAERIRFAVAAYNAGEGRVAAAQERAERLRSDPTRYESIRAFLPKITQQYVDRVMHYAGRAREGLRAASERRVWS